MSGKMPVVTGREMIKILGKKGFVAKRKPGSHVIFTHPDFGEEYRTSVPNHRKPLKPGTLKSILRQANITREEFLRLCGKKH